MHSWIRTTEAHIIMKVIRFLFEWNVINVIDHMRCARMLFFFNCRCWFFLKHLQLKITLGLLFINNRKQQCQCQCGALNELNDNNEDWNIHIQRKFEIKTEISIVIAKKREERNDFYCEFHFSIHRPTDSVVLFIAERDRLWSVRVCVQSVCYCKVNCISICSLRVTFILIFRSHSLSRQSHVADENLYLMTAICVYVCVCSWHVSCSLLADVFCALPLFHPYKHTYSTSHLRLFGCVYSLSRISIYS